MKLTDEEINKIINDESFSKKMNKKIEKEKFLS